MWLNCQGIINIVPIPWLKDHVYKIDYHSDQEWMVTTPGSKEIIYKQDKGKCNCMPYIDMCNHKEAFAMVQTVCKYFEGYIKREVEKATFACQAQAMMGHPTDEKFKQLVSLNIIKICPVTPCDIANITVLFKASCVALRDKIVMQKLDRAEIKFISIPSDFYELHNFVIMTMNIMFVNGGSSLNKIVHLNARSGFIVHVILIDMELDKVQTGITD